VKRNSFGLLELEMVDLERFWRKTPLCPLEVNIWGKSTLIGCAFEICFA
jgi:hypothetical protein